MAVQQQGQPSNVVLGAERPIMPVVSINPALLGNQLVGGPHSLQALPIVNQPSPDQIQAAQQLQASQQMQPPSEAPNMPILVTSPERSNQMECPMMPPPASTPMIICNEDPTKMGTPSKKDPNTTKIDETSSSNSENTSGQ